MANYSIATTSKFHPFSYQELLAPALLATQAHQALEEAYGDLNLQTSIWEGLTEGSPKAREQYRRFAEDLAAEAESLSKQGLTPTSRQAMLNMRGRFGKEITPIEQAYKRRETQAEEQRKLGDSKIFDYDASTTNLDKYLENPAMNYKSIDRKDLYTRAVTDFSHYAKALSDYGNGKKLDAYHNTFIQTHGITREQARDFIEAIRSGNISAADPTLRAVYNAIYGSTGVGNWNNPEADNRVKETILEGVSAAIGSTAVSPYEDKGAIMAQQLRNSKALVNYQLEQQENQRLKMFNVDPTDYFSADEITKKNKEVAVKLDKWKNKDYFDSNGNLTEKGKQALNYKVIKEGVWINNNRVPGGGYYVGRKESGDYEFYNWVKSNSNLPEGVDGLSGAATKGNYQSLLQNKATSTYRNMRNAIASGQLATGTANFQVYRQKVNSSYRKQIADDIYNLIGDGKIYEAGTLSNGTITKGKGYTAAEFAKEIGGYEPSNTNNPANIFALVNSPVTGERGQQLIELTNGKKFIIPSGEQFFGKDTYRNLSEANLKIRGSRSIAELATNANRANSYLAAPMITVQGEEIKPNDGTITIDLDDLLEEE